MFVLCVHGVCDICYEEVLDLEFGLGEIFM